MITPEPASSASPRAGRLDFGVAAGLDVHDRRRHQLDHSLQNAAALFKLGDIGGQLGYRAALGR